MIADFVEKMKRIQDVLLEFLEDESDAEDKYENFVNLIASQKIINDKYEFKDLLNLIKNIGFYYHRVPGFIFKIERLLKHFKNEIQKYLSNWEIFRFFGLDKRITLFLIEEKILTIDENIFSILTSNPFIELNYSAYFAPEIKPFLTKENIEKYSSQNPYLKNDKFIEKIKNIDDDFYKKRLEGENDDYLYQLIRSDKINEFVTFVNQTNLSLDISVKKSFFETNPRLVEKFDVKLIEYAAFFGSFKIVQYLIKKLKNVDPSIWNYAINSNDAKMIHLLEDSKIKPELNQILEESIMCHHNKITDYIINNLIKEEDLQNDIENDFNRNLYFYAVENFNYRYFPSNMKYKNMFHYLCRFDHYSLLKLYFEEGNIIINEAVRLLII